MCSVTSAWLTKPWKNSCARSTSNVADHRARERRRGTRGPGGPRDRSPRATAPRRAARRRGRSGAMPFLSPTALRERLAERDADVLDRVVGVDVQVALGLDRRGRSGRGARPGRACGRGTARRSRACARPLPSRSSSTPICVSVVLRVDRGRCGLRVGGAFMGIRVACSAVEQRVVLGGRADGDAQAVGEQRMPAVEILHQDAGVSQRREPRVGASGTRTSTKLACARKHASRPAARRARLPARARSRRIAAACSSSSAACRSSTGATACVSTLTL